MKRFLCFLIALFLLGLTYCDSNEGGTGISNPPDTVTSYAPDFDEEISEEALTASSLSSLIKALTGLGTTRSLEAPGSNWEDVVHNGVILNNRTNRSTLEDFSTEVYETVQELGLTPSEEVEQITLDETTLIDTSAEWIVNVNVDSGTGFLRLFIINPNDTLIWGYYIVELDADGFPQQGMFGYVNRNNLTTPLSSGLRFFVVVYNFEDSPENKMVVLGESYDESASTFIAHQTLYQCYQTDTQCIAEYIEITTPAPTREFSDRTMRFSWDNDTLEICAAPTTYTDTGIELGTTQLFSGTPTDANVTTGECEVFPPVWDGALISTSDFVERYEDTTPNSGYAGDLAGDGSDPISWETILDENNIDSILSGE